MRVLMSDSLHRLAVADVSVPVLLEQRPQKRLVVLADARTFVRVLMLQRKHLPLTRTHTLPGITQERQGRLQLGAQRPAVSAPACNRSVR